MSQNDTVVLTPEELKLLLEAMQDEEFIMSIPLLLDDLDKEDFDAEKEIILAGPCRNTDGKRTAALFRRNDEFRGGCSQSSA